MVSITPPDIMDYYTLIARAIAGLDPRAPGEARRALYERARAALIAQLDSAAAVRNRSHPRAVVPRRCRPQGRIRGRPARPRRFACGRRRHRCRWRVACRGCVCTENLIRVDDVVESLKLAE